MPRCEIIGSYDSSNFKFWRKLPTVSHRGCSNLQSHQQCGKIPFSLHYHKHLLFSVFWIIAILPGGKIYLTVVLILTSLTISDVEHLSYVYWPSIHPLCRNVYSYFI